MDLLKHCAYNQTSDRLLGVDVAAADFSDTTLHERMAALRPRSGTGLWMVPFRGLPSDGLGMPLDLLYLDEGCHVIDAVESFPRYRVSSSARPAASVLALPTDSIATTQTHPGDQLVVCSANELKTQLRQRPHALEGVDPDQITAQIKEQTEAGIRAHEQHDADRANFVPQAAGKSEKTKSWWQKLVNPDPPDPRRAIREHLPGLTAYYWTGGESMPRSVRDISASGIYVVTEERWYPGTVVRMTLTMRDERGREQSIAVQSRAMRWGNDGVGLEFVMVDPKEPTRGEWLAPDGANREQFEEFIRKVKT